MAKYKMESWDPSVVVKVEAEDDLKALRLCLDAANKDGGSVPHAIMDRWDPESETWVRVGRYNIIYEHENERGDDE